ncbi:MULTISPECIES: TIGR03086 family metal-binding protein [unclassified Actinotalea]|uniref:TIGR03086 family metal-binding protein n=1 Tax=unclassified Actinotalea TaxID=2638618 RepID=UPI0015F3BFFE|nr:MULTISPECIES: TIGR03086 family metal-binding protein [unclassified Actinotalea]
MDTTLEQYETADRPLTALIDATPPDAWDRPSPCEGWAARDVVAHMVETQRSFFAERGIDLGAAPDVVADPAAAWHAHAARVRAALADEEVATKGFDGFFGPTTLGAALVQFYVWDMVVHRWDVATAVGADPGLTEAEVDRMEAGAAGFGDALYMEGICRPGVEPAAGADRATTVLARLGRRTGVPAQGTA